MNEQKRILAERYCAYLLRFWRGDDGWHVLAKNVQSGEEQHFATVNACMDFLQAACSEPTGKTQKGDN